MNVDPKVHRMVIGKVIATLRKRKEVGQSDFAKAIGVSQPTLSRLERGQMAPDVVLFSHIADALGLSSTELHRLVEDSLERAQQAAEGATRQSAGSDSVWSTALRIAGVVGLAGLAAFAVAAALNDDED